MRVWEQGELPNISDRGLMGFSLLPFNFTVGVLAVIPILSGVPGAASPWSSPSKATPDQRLKPRDFA
jgi:hypothetical protein